MDKRVSSFLGLAVLGLACLFLLAATPVKVNRGLIWLAEGDSGRQLYLVGSFHLAKPDFYPLGQAIDEAFERADNLVVELDVESLSQEETLALFSVGFNQDGLTLTDQLSPETLNLLSRIETPAPMSLLQTMRPWMAAMTLEALFLLKRGYSDTYGLDSYFIKLAKKRSLPISELESPQEQISLFTDLTPKEQDLFFQSVLEDGTSPVAPIEKYSDFWKDGDAVGFNEAMNQERLKKPELDHLFDRLIVNRNKNLANRLTPFFYREGKVYFVLVGAAHLVGPEGIPALLAKAGFKVTQL
jgi:uncharacterized protein YbaP (TraB family)